MQHDEPKRPKPEAPEIEPPKPPHIDLPIPELPPAPLTTPEPTVPIEDLELRGVRQLRAAR